MIRIERGAEPASLAPVRAAELLRVRPLAMAGAIGKDDVGQQYSIVKHDLWLRQQMRCCYCEAPVQCEYNDVEHFRPKARADRLNGMVASGYWWLAWTWENLLFCCAFCNRSAKNDSFPLEAGSVPLAAETPAPGQELATFIDPCSEDPVALIQFVFDGSHWQPVGRNGNARGQRVVELLKLARADLLTRYNAHVKDHVEHRIEGFHDALALRNEFLIRKAWQRVCGLLASRMPFVALSFDAISHFVPENLRTLWSLALPRPPVRGP